MDIINVLTGEVKVEINENMMVSNAIGSCIVISAYDPINKLGGMAHIMLPGRAPNKTNSIKLRYAENAIETLINELKKHVSSISELMFCLVGGGNVLKNTEDKICKFNIQSVKNIVQKHQLKIVASSLGGYKRRTSKLDIKNGIFYYTEGDSKDKVLYNAHI